MEILKTIGTIYLIGGFIYAFLIMMAGSDRWYHFPINVLGGPIVLGYMVYTAFKRPRGYNYAVNHMRDIFGNKSAVLFDMDSTLVVTRPLWIESYRKVFAELGVEGVGHDDLKGVSTYEMWEYALSRKKEWNIETTLTVQELTDRTNKAFIALLGPKSANDFRARDGFWQLAHELKIEKNVRLGLVTNTDRVVANCVLEKLGATKTFDVVVCGDDVKRADLKGKRFKKPSPLIYLNAAQRLGVPPEKVVVFENSVIGSTAAVKAKMNVLIIWNDAVARGAYPQEALGFFEDFTYFPGNMDKNRNEVIRDLIERAKPPENQKAVA